MPYLESKQLSSLASDGELSFLTGQVTVTSDVPSTYASVVVSVAAEHVRNEHREFRLCISGGSSGSACLKALLSREDFEPNDVKWFLADERCVEVTDERSNYKMVHEALVEAGCDSAFVQAMTKDDIVTNSNEISRFAGYDLVQLGFGPDGHTASLFSASPALSAPPGELVTTNYDPSGRNPLQRITLTLEAISLARTVVITVVGSEKAGALQSIRDGASLPASLVKAKRVIWIVDENAVTALGQGPMTQMDGKN